MSKVCIDAGHYGKYNVSPVNAAYYESVQMWRLHELLAAELKKRGVTVVLTRQSQAADLSLISRGKKAKGCDLFLSLHSNAASTEGVDYPVAMVLRPNSRTTIDEKSAEIGLTLAKVVQSTMGTTQAARTATRASGNDRDGNGLLDDEYYGVLEGARQVGVPAVILEHSFHTNKKATAWLLVDANLQRLAKAEADAIAAWLGVKAPVQTSSTASTGTAAHYGIKITCDALNIRTGPGTGYKIAGVIRDKKTYTIIKEQNGWGLLKSKAGWISLKYTRKI